MTFQQIVSSGKLSTCRNIVKARLSELVEEGFLSVDPKDWRPGMKKFYSLTSYGKKQVILNLAKNSAEILEDMKEILIQAKLDDPRLVDILALALKAELSKPLPLFVEDVYALLPKNAELVASTETEEERETCKTILKETGGKVQISIPEKRRE
jgi:hypothetical protein